jgi:hypothetical protein
VALIEEADGKIIQKTATDARGSFAFEGVAMGAYVASYALVGGDTSRTPEFSVTAQRPAVDLGRLTLNSGDQIKLEKVEVTSRREQFYNSIDRKVYNVGKDIESSAGSASDLLQNIPSVQLDIDGNVSLRGNGDVLVLIDGKPTALMSTANRADALAQLAADSIERIEVITNPSAKFKPDGTAGIINIVLKRKHAPGYSGTFRANVGNDGRSNYGLSGNYNPGKFNISLNLSVRKDFRRRISQDNRTHLDPATDAFISTEQGTVETMRPLTRLAELGAEFNVDDDDRIGATVDYNYRTFHRTSTIENATMSADGTDSTAYDRIRSDPEWQKTMDFGTTYRHAFPETGHELSAEIKRERHWEQEDNQYSDVYLAPPMPTSYDDTLIRPTETTTNISVDYSQPMAGDADDIRLHADQADRDHHHVSRLLPAHGRRRKAGGGLRRRGGQGRPEFPGRVSRPGNRDMACGSDRDKPVRLPRFDTGNLRHLRKAVWPIRLPRGSEAGGSVHRHEPGNDRGEGHERLSSALSDLAPGLRPDGHRPARAQLQPPRPPAGGRGPEPVSRVPGPLQPTCRQSIAPS